MNREELAHILRAAAQITEDNDILVIGSQSILGSHDEGHLPPEAVGSIEADLAFFDDPDEEKSNLVDGAIGEGSSFHEMFGIYGQGVSVSTAVLPAGWADRLVPYERADAKPSEAKCLDPHDLVVSKLVAGRDKDLLFARVLIEADLVDADRLRERAQLLDVVEGVKRRVVGLVDRFDNGRKS